MIYVALFKPEIEGNVGAVARAMKNFGFSKLIIIDPSCDYLSEESRRRSKHAVEILENAKVYKNLDFTKRFNTVIGTTGIVGTDYNIVRSPIDISTFLSGLQDSFAGKDGLKKLLLDQKSKILLLFGPEGTGLTNDELKCCDHLINIKTSKDYRALNLSHAVSIVLYEFSKVVGIDDCDTKKNNNIPKRKSDHRDSGVVEIAERSEKDRLYKFASESVRFLYEKDPKMQVVNDSMKKLISKSVLTKREVFALMGFYKKITQKKVSKSSGKSSGTVKKILVKKKISKRNLR